MHHLGVKSVALGGLGWPEEVNLAIEAVLADAGIDVAYQMVRDDTANNPAQGLDSLLESVATRSARRPTPTRSFSGWAVAAHPHRPDARGRIREARLREHGGF
jgi:hypothetical protein